MRYKIIILFAFVSCLCAYSADPWLMIYRNDENFHKVRFSSGTKLEHKGNPESMKLSIYSPEDEGTLSIALDVIDSCLIRESDIPELRFTFPDYPNVKTLWDKELYINAYLTVEGNNYTDDASYDALKVKGRGNSTWTMPKKPLRLKFDKKQSLCGLSKAKSFVLLANFIDESLCKNSVALWLADRLGVAYANHFVPCNVYINDNYQGSYLLTEKIGINGASVDIDDSTGVLLELSTEFDEPYKFRSAKWSLPVMIKDPDFDELAADDPEGLTAAERLAIWEADFNAAEKLVANKRGFEAFDLEAFVSYYLLYNISINNEIGHPKSVYIHKTAPGSDTKYIFGPAWDFDYAFNRITMNGGKPTYFAPDGTFRACELVKKLAASSGFKEEYKKQFTRFKDEIYPDLLEFIDSYTALIEPSAKLDGLTWTQEQSTSWYFRHSTFDAATYAKSLRDWIVARVEAMSKEIE